MFHIRSFQFSSSFAETQVITVISSPLLRFSCIRVSIVSVLVHFVLRVLPARLHHPSKPLPVLVSGHNSLTVITVFGKQFSAPAM